MRNISKKELSAILHKHKLWFENDSKGVKANLYGADLRGADLCGADLRGANLYDADLRGADLYGANLYDADLRGADLHDADLRGTNLCGANLYGADLCGADLRWANLYDADLCGADLRWADLHDADLRGTNLCGANLYGADLRGANLYGADLRGANLRGADLCGADLNYPVACPEKGSFVAFKKVTGDRIVELRIPENARRSSATTRKCRCDKAFVVNITHLDGSYAGNEAASKYDENFIYKVGEMVSVDNFCEDRWNECAPGIHFFITRDEAVNY